MSFPDAEALRRHPRALAALSRGDAGSALEGVAGQAGAAAQRVAGRALLALGDRDGARRVLTSALADAAGDPEGQALAHAALASVARATGEPGEAIGHLEWALIDAPPAARRGLHREAATIAYRAGLLADAEFHARQTLADAPERLDGSSRADDAERLDGSSRADDADRLDGSGHADAADAPERDDASGSERPDSEMVVAEDHARLGAILSERGRDAEAVEHLGLAATALCELAGTGHVETLRVRAELAESLQDLGRVDDAAAEHRAVLAGRETALGPDHPELAPTLLALSALSAAGADAETARQLADRAYALLDGRVPADHPLLADARAARAAAGS